MQNEEVIEEIIVTLPFLHYEDWFVLALLATALMFGILAWLQRQGKPWIGWMLVLTSIPAFSFIAPLARDVHLFSDLQTTDITVGLWFGGPYLSSIVLLLWKLRLLVPRPVARGTVLAVVCLLTLVVVSDAYLVAYLHDDWFFPEPTPYIFGLSAVASVILMISVLLRRISAPTSVSSLLMMIFVVHSAVGLSAQTDVDLDLGVWFYVHVLAIAIFAAEIGFTSVREWGADAYWVWEADQAQQCLFSDR